MTHSSVPLRQRPGTSGRRTLRLASLLLVGCQACLPDYLLAPPDPDLAPSGSPNEAVPLGITSVSVDDYNGKPWPLDAMPRRPRIRLHATRPLMPTKGTFLLLRGAADADVVQDLSDAPLRASTLDRAVASTVTVDGSDIVLEPETALPNGTTYSVVAGAWATDGTATLGMPFAEALRVTEGDGGASATESWPPDASSGVPTALALIAIHFDGAIDPTTLPDHVHLERGDGTALPAQATLTPCADLGWPSGQCMRVNPSSGLQATTSYRIRIDEQLRDSTGAPVGPWSTSFTTGDGTYLAPAFVAPTCLLDEQSIPPVCVFATDRSIELRAQMTGAVRVFLSGGLTTSSVLPRGDIDLRIGGLEPSTSFAAVLTTIDLAGTETRVDLLVATTPPLAAVAVTEVRADALGPEPRQEYVEVHNQGTVALDLQGFAISDAADRLGDVIAQPSPLAPGARALIVADAFDPSDPLDVPVPAGVPLIRIGAAIGSSGLSNAGEPVWLRDPTGRRISGAPAAASIGGGICLVRIASDPRRADASAFAWDPQGTCTPGR